MFLRNLADKLDKCIYPMLLFSVAVIPLEQEFTAFCVTVTFLCAAFAAAVKGRRQPAVLKPWQQGALYALFAIGWISLHFSRDKFLSSFNYIYVAGQYCAMVFVLLRYGWVRPQPFVRRVEQGSLKVKFAALPRPLQLIGAFLAVSVLVSCIGLAQKFLGVSAENIWVDPEKFPDIKVRVYSTLVNPNILGGYLVLVIAYAAAFFSCFRKWRGIRLFFLGTGLLAALCLLYTYSRGNWLACAAVMLVFCLFYCHKAFIPVAAAGAAGFLIGGHSVVHRLASIISGEDTSAALRMAYLKSTKWIIEEFPLGVGWYGYRFVYPEYNYYLSDTSVIMYHCHNIFLNVLAELGWHGLLAFLTVWGIFLFNGWKLAGEGRTPWLKAMGRGYVLASVGIAVGGLTDHVYFNTQMGLLFWTMGILTMICRKLNAYEP